MITLNRVCKEYLDGEETVCVLDDVNFCVEKGSMHAIMGRSGCGKSTLLNIVGGIVEPTSGEIWIDGNKIDYYKKKKLFDLRRKYFGYVVQNFALINQKTVFENVILPIQSKEYRRNNYCAAEQLLDEVGIVDKKNKYPYQLSNGERQRVAIARALVDDKKIILADEPTGALDYENAENIICLLKRLVQDKKVTVLIATHDREIAKECDKVSYIKYGKVGYAKDIREDEGYQNQRFIRN